MTIATAAADVRINARLTGADAALFQNLLDATRLSASELLRVALREYHHARAQPKHNPLELLTGYIGAGEGPRDLSANYKAYLTESLEDKLPLMVHEAAPRTAS